MNPLAETAFRQMVAEDGIVFDVITDLDDLILLNTLGEKVTGSGSPVSQALLRPVLHIGGAEFRRLSIGAQHFTSTVLREWAQDKIDIYNMGYAYCMAHSTETQKLWAFERDHDGLTHAVHQWMKSLSVDYPTLHKALEDFNAVLTGAISDRTHVPRKEPDYGWLIDMLVSEYGQTAEYWIFKAPPEEIRNHHRQYLDRRAREFCRGGMVPMDAEGAYFLALKRFRDFEEDLRQRKKAPTCHVI